MFNIFEKLCAKKLCDKKYICDKNCVTKILSNLPDEYNRFDDGIFVKRLTKIRIWDKNIISYKIFA